MKISITLFLKISVRIIGLPVLVFCIFLAPKIGNFVGELYPNIAYIKSLVLILLYGAAVPFYFALYQAFNLLRYIDKSKAFSELSVKGLKHWIVSQVIFWSTKAMKTLKQIDNKLFN